MGHAESIREIEGGGIVEVGVGEGLGHSSGFPADHSVGIGGSVWFVDVSIHVAVCTEVDHGNDHGQKHKAAEDIPAFPVGLGHGAILDIRETC